MLGTAIETMVWSMKVIETAKIIAARTRVLFCPPSAIRPPWFVGSPGGEPGSVAAPKRRLRFADDHPTMSGRRCPGPDRRCRRAPSGPPALGRGGPRDGRGRLGGVPPELGQPTEDPRVAQDQSGHRAQVGTTVRSGHGQ